jgi:D-alanine-D-alanine ligase
MLARVPPVDRVRLVVLFGGRSAEHDISRVSASHVLRAVDPARYDVVPVGILRDGTWVIAESARQLLDAGRVAELPPAIDTDGPAVEPLPVLRDHGGASSPTVVLPVLHGPNGEDGTVQGLLEVAGVPYVGAGVLGSSVAMDKAMAKSVLDAHGIPQARWLTARPADVERADELIAPLADHSGVVFVKPANMGSSIGVSRVAADDTGAVRAALEVAFAYDDVAVVEEGVTARELECGVLGNDDDADPPRASVVGEIVPAADFYDFDDKYADGAAATVVPADLPPEVAADVRRLAVRTFRSLRIEGMARVDVFWEDGTDGRPGRGLLVNEANTIPGFTPISMFPMMWRESGLDYPALIDELVRLALARHARRSRHLTDHSGGRPSSVPTAPPGTTR